MFHDVRPAQVDVPPMPDITSHWRGVVQRHWLPLLLVLLADGIGQLATLFQQPLATLTPDSHDYLNALMGITQHLHLIDPYRTPGYPLLLVLLTAGNSGQLTGIVLGQAALLVLATCEIYVLAYRLSQRRWIGCIAAAAIGTNLYILNWERLVLSEMFSIWLLVTLCYCFERYLRSSQARYLVGLTALSVVIIFTRPIFICVPAVLVLVLALHAYRQHTLRHTWQRLALVLALSYGCVFAYAGANAVLNGYVGISYVSGVSLFGKVLVYHMQDDTNDPRFAQVRRDADAYVRAGHNEPWIFVQHDYPDQHYDANNYALLSAYSADVILHHPTTFLGHVAVDVFQALQAPPIFYAANSKQDSLIRYMTVISSGEFTLYPLLPLLLALMLVWVWRRPEHITGVVLCAMLALACADVGVATFTGFDEFYRLRSPCDWMIVLITVLALLEIGRLFAGRQAVLFGVASTADTPGRDDLPPIAQRMAALTPGATTDPQH